MSGTTCSAPKPGKVTNWGVGEEEVILGHSSEAGTEALVFMAYLANQSQRAFRLLGTWTTSTLMGRRSRPFLTVLIAERRDLLLGEAVPTMKSTINLESP